MNAPVAHHSDWVLGRYELVTRIASGGSGSVFLARDGKDQSEVVVKFIDAREDAMNGWIREMRIALRLSHEAIVRCRTVGFDDNLGAWALVYDYAEGGSLRRALVQKKSLGIGTAREVVADVAQALAYAHEHDVVHRDVKPENIVRGPARWQLTDFGDARFLARGKHAETVVGSLSYMAPETFLGRTTRLADQYSLGVVGLECVRGQIHTRRALRTLPTEARDQSSFEQILAQMLAPHPSDRFPTIDVVSALLELGHSDARWLSDGDACAAYDGSSVHWWFAGERHRFSTARFSRFVRCSGTGVGALLGHRLIRMAEERRTIYADETPYTPLCFEDSGHGWIAREGSLLWISPQGVEASGRFNNSESLCAPDILAACSGRTLVAGQVGTKLCTVAHTMGDAVVAVEHTLAAPLDTIVRTRDSLRVLAADDHKTIEYEVEQGRLEERGSYPAPRGHVRYVDNEISVVRFFDTAEFFRGDRQNKEALQ